ncbi:phage tail sheath subtilisin-like domain-containing protein [Roseomonas xinghualingensis]|uniref:phage tail sheath subtilisin-like domain-containing protein n=1 Tax=Roseomonas xinghualingensis TaxID=2986475 RepID=UPI0021F24C31|nr:phage tail sheath subtilisin-like domain-containing protein [Roseomonas sp. SXEYE001]MCV4207570.1 phage tail sheath subtilisin-like domain-containing protein [Roseomonas sp. SXEYE001]
MSFNEIPGGGALRVPLFFAELDATRANRGGRLPKTLIIAQQLAAGTLPAGVPVLVQGVDWTKNQAGQGSMAALMVEKYRARDDFGPVYLLPLADDGAAAAASGTVAFSAAATSAGTFVRRIAGQRVAMAVSPSQTTAQLAAAFAAAVTALPGLPVTAAASTSTVTLTAKHKGAIGNEIVVTETDDPVPPGLAFTVTQPSGGTGSPVTGLTNALATLGDMDFDFIAMPYTDAASLDALKAHLAARWAWSRMLYGGAFAAIRGTLGTVTTAGAGRNDPHVSLMGFDSAPEPAWLWAAAITAAAAVSIRADVTLPLQTVVLNVLPPPVNKRWGLGDRNALLFTGIATHTVGDDGTVRIERLVTTYQKNAFGQPDDSLLDVERLYQIADILRRQRNYVESTWPRMALADDGTRFRPGKRIVTPSMIKRGLALHYRSMEREGLVQNADAYAEALVIERDSQNRCRVNGISPTVPVDQLRQVAIQAQLRDAVGVAGDL